MPTDEIRIICDDKRHPSKVVRIARMVRDQGGWWDMGSPSVRAKREAEAEAVRRGVRLWNPDRSRTNYRSDDGSSAPRDKYRWRCELCGLDVNPGQDKAGPFLDTLAANGVAEISLRSLSTRL